MSERSAIARSAAPAAPAAAAAVRATPAVAREPRSARAVDGAIDTAAAGAREADAPEPPPLPPILPVRRLRADESPPDFSRVANRGIDRIRDPDDARAQATRHLLLQLAPVLGLDPARLRITVSADGGARIEARGANALQDGDEVLLHPGRYRPQTDAGRYLLAHELTHAAQRQLGGAPVRRAAAGQLRAAEDEAARIGRDFVAGRPLQRPRIALRGHVVAADTGATEEVLPALVDSVKTSRSRELAIIRDALDGWWVSDGDVFTVMRILDSVSFPVAVAMVGALSRDERYWLADNINPPHMYQHRRSVLATYRALEPDRFDAIDLKVMRALPDRGLTVDETEAAVYALEHLSRERLDALLASEKGDAIARLIGAPLPTPAQRERILDAQRQATKEEAELAKKRERVVALQKDDGVSRIVDAIAERLSAPRDDRGEPRHPVAADALAVIEMLSAQLGDNDRFLAIAERMEAKGLIETLLNLTPPERFLSQDDPTASEVLIGLAQSRLPIRNEQLVEDLLSYGLFDWAIRDHEALFAYRLIKLMPMAAQYRFRQRDSGKWYLRLLENLPDDPTTGARRTGLEIRKAESREEETYYYNASEIYERKLAATGVVEARDQLLADFRQARKGIYRDAEAITLYRKLVELGRGTLEPGKESTGDDILRETLIRELDRENMIDELFGELPNDFLFAEENRISTVKIMLSRDSMRVQAHARELVGYGALDWMVKDNEAYLAYLCLKALPAEERSAFVQANPDHWARIQSELDPDARQARDLNLYIGDKAGTDRASVLAQLADAQNWTADNATILDSLLRMAMAMTEHRFAFERSREFNAVADVTLAPLVEKYRLWNPAQGREIYRADILKQTRWYEEGLVQSLKSLWSGLVTLWRTDILFVDGKIGARVDLNDVQDFMGGDLMGARLADPAKRGSRQQGESEGGVSPDANKLTLLLDPEWFGGQGKSAELILPQVLIDSTNVQTEGTTVQTGIVDLKGLHIRAAYDGQNSGQPAQANVSLDSLIVNDLLIARSSRIYTLTRLIVTTLRLAAGTIDSTTGAPPAVREGRYIPFPLLVLMMLPWLAQMAMVALMAIPIRRIEKAADQGLEPDNRFQQDMLTRTKAIDISFAQLKAEGFSSSDGQHVGDVRIDDFALRAGLNKATRLRAELASIEDRLAHLPDTGENRSRREALIARRGELESAQKDIEAQEREYLEIQRRIRAGGLKPEDQKTLQQRLAALDFEDTGEVFLDIGHMEASGIRGTVTSRDKIELNNVHGQGGSSALLGMVSGPTATPDALARRAQAGERAPALVSGDRPGDFTLELGDVTTGRLEVGGGVRSVEDIDAQLEDLKKDAQIPELQPLIESLQMLRTKAQRHEAMVAYGVSSLSPAELDEFRALRRLLTADAALIVESIALTRARLHADLASGRIDIGMDKARITGLQLPQKGIQVEEMTASGVRAGAMPASGLLDWLEWKKRLRDADAGIDTLEIRNARSKYHGLLFEKATMTGASASVKARGDDITLGIGHLAVEGLGLAPRLGLLNRRLSGLRQKVRVAEGAEKTALEDEIGKLSTRIDTLQGLADSRLAAYLRLERAKTPEEIAAAEAALHEVDVMIILDFKQYGAAVAELDEFGVNVAGAGDLLSDALGGGIDPLAVLERGVRVTGTGTDQQLFKKLSVRGLETTGEDAKGHLSADAGAFDVTGAKLDLSAKKNGDDIEITVPKFDIKAIDIRDFLLTTLDAIDDPEATGGGLQLWSRGTSHLQKISYSGKVTLTSRVKGSRDLSDYRLKHVRIDSFEIGKLIGDGLGLAYDDGENHVELREANPYSEWKMTGFKPLFLQNLKVWGLDWTPDTGVSAANGSIGSYAANAHYTGIKSGLLAGIALRGTGMTAEVVGPGAYTLDVGKIEETSGKYDDGKLETDFGTGAIVGKIAIGPDYVEAQNVQIDKTALTGTYYADGPRKVSLTSANVAKITLGSVRQNYLLSTDENNETQKTPGTLEVRDLELFDVKAGYFSYKGESEGKVMKEGVETTEKSTQSVRGDGAWISHMRIGGFVRDPVDSSMTVTGVSVDNGPGAKAGAKPFGVRGLVADLTSTIGTEKTSKYLTTDIEGGPLTAERITFRTVTLGVNTEGPKPEEVTRTEIDGAFNLTHLGLVNPNLTLTDAKGKTTRIHSTDDKSGRIDIAGITPRSMPNGTVALPIKSVIGAGLTVDIGDNKTISLDKLLIEDIAVGLQGMGTDEGLDMLATKIGKIQVDGLKVKIVSRRKAELSDKEYADAMAEYRQAQADAKKDPPGTFTATPLGGLNGKLSGEYSLSPVLDSDIDPEFKNGVIDFGGMTYFAVQLHTVDDGKGGKKDVIELGNGISIKTLKDFGRKMPGFYGDAGKSWYGQINIKETVEGLMNEPGSEPSRIYEAASALSDFYGFHGDLSLGSGRMGYDKDGDKALGRGDTWIDLQRKGVASRNTLHMNESNIGERIDLTSPEIYASGAGFTAGKTRKVRLSDGTVREAETRIGTTDDISFETVGLQIEGLAHMTLTITLTVQKGTIRNIHIGDLTFADAAGLSTLKAPTLTDVDPKGKPIPMTPPAGGTP